MRLPSDPLPDGRGIDSYSGSGFFSSRRRHTRSLCDWSSDVCSSDLNPLLAIRPTGFALPPLSLLRDKGGSADPVGRIARRWLFYWQLWRGVMDGRMRVHRSEEGRVGEGRRSIGLPYHSKKKQSLDCL